jgi:hypothetical protein
MLARVINGLASRTVNKGVSQQIMTGSSCGMKKDDAEAAMNQSCICETPEQAQRRQR